MSKVEKVLVEVDTLIMYAGWADDANCRNLYAHLNNMISQKIKEQRENPTLDPWQPNTSSHYDKSIHSNPDAKAWADFFIDTFPGLADKHDLMHTWFANVMMAMHDHLLSKQPKPIPTSKRLPTEADADCHGCVWVYGLDKNRWVMTHWMNAKRGYYWLPTGLTLPPTPGDSDEQL